MTTVEKHKGAVYIGDDATERGDERGTFLHVINPGNRPAVPGTVVYLRMGDWKGRHLSTEEATALRDALNDALGATK